MKRWLHQERAVADTLAAIDAGHTRICLTSPTGGGKSVIMQDLIAANTARSGRTILYSNRKMLTEQLASGLRDSGIRHGIRAAGHVPDFSRNVQISSLQTEYARVYRTKKWELFKAGLVLIDEAHNCNGDVAKQIINDHIETGAVVVGVTATPVDIGDTYKKLIVAGTKHELRQCGALVPAFTYGPDEPDCRDLKRTPTGEFTEGSVRKVIMTATIFARVIDNWKTLNPDARPAILFAPGVGESLWFAEQFKAAGVAAAHIDGDDVWIDGKQFKSSAAARADILAGSKDGRIKVICNRFVMREGIDAPWLYHGIFATVFGGLTSFLQSGGRLLRAHPTLDHVVIQDHGGNWLRHGSLNVDRQWSLEDTNNEIRELREQRFRDKVEQEPICCPKCHAVRFAGSKCQKCGFEHRKSTRIVVQRDGTLKAVHGDVHKPRRIKCEPSTQRHWDSMYYRAKKSAMTFRQAEALFFLEQHYYPPRTLANMPRDEKDWKRKVADVRHDALIPKQDVPVGAQLVEGAA